MKSTTIIRKTDSMGRLTLPFKIRNSLEINTMDPIEFFIEKDKIILQKYEPCDIFIGNKEELYEFHGKQISKSSIIELAKMAGLM